MNNKILLSLSLFLVFPAATHCMEKEIVLKPKTMQEIKNECVKFEITLHNNYLFWWWGTTDCPNSFFLDCTYRQEFHKETYRERASHCQNLQTILDENFFRSYNIKNLSKLPADQLKILKKIRSDEDALYSCLGSATMAQNVSFQEIKEFIQKLLNLGFAPTPNDKELAFFRKYQEFGPAIIKKMLLLQDILLTLDTDIRQAFIKYIPLLMFEIEESLL